MPGTYRNADPTSQVDRSGTLDAHDIKLIGQTPVIGETSAPIPLTTTSILPIALDLLDGLAGSITILGQVYQNGAPISDLRNRVTSVIDSITAEIRPEPSRSNSLEWVQRRPPPRRRPAPPCRRRLPAPASWL